MHNTAQTSSASDITENSTTPTPTLAESVGQWFPLTPRFFAVVAGALIIGALVGALVSVALQPKPINPSTYTKPLQVEQTSLQQQTRYGRVVSLNYVLLVSHYNQMVTDLNASNVSASEGDATLLSTSTATFLTDLQKTTVPVCLQSTNAAFVQGLTSIQQGASLLDKALVANDAGQSNQAGRQIAQGFDQITTAEGDYAAAVC